MGRTFECSYVISVCRGKCKTRDHLSRPHHVNKIGYPLSLVGHNKVNVLHHSPFLDCPSRCNSKFYLQSRNVNTKVSWVCHREMDIFYNQAYANTHAPHRVNLRYFFTSQSNPFPRWSLPSSSNLIYQWTSNRILNHTWPPINPLLVALVVDLEQMEIALSGSAHPIAPSMKSKVRYLRFI